MTTRTQNGQYLIWRPRTPSEHAPRIRLDQIVATTWDRPQTTHQLWVYMAGGHTIKLDAAEGNQLLEAWARYVDAGEAPHRPYLGPAGELDRHEG